MRLFPREPHAHTAGCWNETVGTSQRRRAIDDTIGGKGRGGRAVTWWEIAKGDG